MLDGIIAGVVANALFLIFLTALGTSVTLILVVHTRRRRLRFLGIRRPVLTSQIPIFIAHLVVVKGGALLADGTPSEYFEGSAVPIKEVQAAERVQKMLKPVAGLEYLPLALRSRLERLSVGLTTIELPVSPAPLVINDFANISHLIVIGGPEFNKAAEHFMERGRMFRVLDPAECEQPTIALITDAGEDLITPDSVMSRQVV